MSRIGQSPVYMKDNVEAILENKLLKLKGPKGFLEMKVSNSVDLKINNDNILIENKDNTQKGKANWGTTRALINNMVEGVTNGYVIEQELIGVGYRAKTQGQRLELSLGYSHPIIMELPSEVKVTAVSEKGKNPLLKLESCDKQLIGQVAGKIRSFRKPEPYKGKGILFKGETIRRKAGKSAAK